MIYFLSSIPRSGSTLLASLLGQREDTHVSKTSNLLEAMGSLVEGIESSIATKASDASQDELYRMLDGVVNGKYSDHSEKYVFDKDRMWPDPSIMKTMREVQGDHSKIVATVRPMVECIASFYLIDKSELSVKEWIKTSQLFNHLIDTYNILGEGYSQCPQNFCLVEYDNLINDPQKELNRIADFIGMPHVDYKPEIEQVDEKDEMWGIADLHTLAPTVQKNQMNARAVLGQEIYDHYLGGEFWNNKPEPVKKSSILDLVLEAGLRGKFDKAEQMLRRELEEHPDNERAQYNLGLYEMMKGNQVRGHKYLDRGRPIDVFGNRDVVSQMPLWDGKEKGVVLMNMEGGFGDGFHCIRFAKDILARGNELVISGDEKVSEIMRSVVGVTTFVAFQGAKYVYHNFWMPSMSAPLYMDLEYSDARGEAYIPRVCSSEGKIGVKWEGNPKFEHQQHRLFPAEMMQDVVEGFDNVVSLQQGEDGMAEGPDWMEKPDLSHWDLTRIELSKCNIVLTSCTGLAHLAGAMGIETWIVVPILPYHTWALPGSKTVHYDSVTLYRQTKYGCWKDPFWKMKKDFRERMWNKKEITEELYNQI